MLNAFTLSAPSYADLPCVRVAEFCVVSLVDYLPTYQDRCIRLVCNVSHQINRWLGRVEFAFSAVNFLFTNTV